MKLFDLTGKVALVTGGNGGIGLGMAQGMASCGASIVISGRNAEKAKTALASLRDVRCEDGVHRRRRHAEGGLRRSWWPRRRRSSAGSISW